MKPLGMHAEFQKQRTEKRGIKIKSRGREKRMGVGKERELLLLCERNRPKLSTAPGSIQTRQSK